MQPSAAPKGAGVVQGVSTTPLPTIFNAMHE